MHSSALTGSNFDISWRGEAIEHAEFFADWGMKDRLGIFAPGRVDGAGAVTLIMAYVTAFYDRYRETGEAFFAYPDFYAFQRVEPLADYVMYDIWPEHKNVLVPEGANGTAAAITDRGVDVLLVPDIPAQDIEFEPAQRAANHRAIRRAFAYDANGTVGDADLVIECEAEPWCEYATHMFNTVSDDESKRKRDEWLRTVESGRLRQTFREVEPEEALRRL